LNDGQGNKIAIFPDGESGAAAHFALLDHSYTGMPLSAAIRKWSGGNSSAEYTGLVSRATGLSPDTVLTHDILASPKGLVLAKAMARQEAGGEFPLSDQGWQNAQARGLGLSAPVQTAALPTNTATDAAPAPVPTSSDGGPKFITPTGAPTGALPNNINAPAAPPAATPAAPATQYVKAVDANGNVGWADASKVQARNPADIVNHRADVLMRFDPVAGAKLKESAIKIASDNIDLTSKQYLQAVTTAAQVAQVDPQRGLQMLTEAYSKNHPDMVTPTFQLNKDGSIGAAYSVNTATGPVITGHEMFPPTKDGKPDIDGIFRKAQSYASPDAMRQRVLDDSKLATDELSRQVDRARIEALGAEARSHQWASTQYGAPSPDGSGSAMNIRQQQMYEKRLEDANKEIADYYKAWGLPKTPQAKAEYEGQVLARHGLTQGRVTDFEPHQNGGAAIAAPTVPNPYVSSARPSAPQAGALPGPTRPPRWSGPTDELGSPIVAPRPSGPIFHDALGAPTYEAPDIAPRDNTAGGLVRTLQDIRGRQQASQQAMAQEEAAKAAKKAAKAAAENPSIKAPHDRVLAALKAGEGPDYRDVLTLKNFIEQQGGAAELMHDAVFDYARKAGQRTALPTQ
jgi:hypothetical protein